MMSIALPISADDLLAMPRDGKRYELVAGELRMMSPSGWKHGEIVGNLHGIMWNHIRANGLGKIFGAETGFLIARDLDTVRAPDIAFIANENLPEQDPEEAYWPGAPDLAVEVLSPSDRTSDVEEKVQAWLAAGSRMVWVVDPKASTIVAYDVGGEVVTFDAKQQLDGGDVLRGFRCSVAEVFGLDGAS